MATPGFNEEHYLSQKLSSLTSQGETQSDGTAFTTTAQVKEAIEAAGLTPESHYEQFGFKEVIVADDDSTTRLTPNDNFVAEEYIAAKAAQLVASDSATYPTLDDAQQAFLDALDGGNVYNHYLEFGDTEGLNPSNSFDADQYFQDKLTDLQADSDSGFDSNSTVDDVKDAFADAGLSAIEHFELFGSDEGLSATAVATADEVDPLGALPAPEGEEGQTFTLTTSINDFTGTADDDTFEQTKDGQLSIDDTLDGGAGDDTLFVRDQDGVTGEFTATNIETIDARNQNDQTATVELDNVSGYTTLAVNALDSNDVTFDEIENSADLTLSVKNVSDTNDDDAIFKFAEDELSGSSDTVNVDLANNSGTLKLDIKDATDNNVIETLAITSSADNSGTINVQDNGALGSDTVTVEGSGDLTLGGSLDGTSFDASSATGDVAATFGTEDQTVTGGEGDDTFTFGSDLSSDDTVDGGAGSNTISVSTNSGSIVDASTDGDFENVSNIDTLALSAAIGDAAATVDLAELEGLRNVVFEGAHTSLATNGSEPVVKGLTNESTVTLKDAAVAAGDELVFQTASNGSDDSLTINLEDDADTNNSVGEFLQGSGTSLETVTLNALDQATTENDEVYRIDVSNFDVGKLVLTGNNAIDLAEGASTTVSAQTNTLDGSDAEGDLSAIAASGASLDATGGSGDDKFVGDSAADIFVGGDGDDKFFAGTGGDTLTGGDGDDIFLIQDEVHDPITITDFSQSSGNNDAIHIDIGSTTGGIGVFANDQKSSNADTGAFSGAVMFTTTSTTLKVDANGFLTATSAGDESGIALRLASTAGDVKMAPLGKVDGATTVNEFTVGSSLVFTGATGTSSTALIAAISKAVGDATITETEAVVNGDFIALFTTTASGKLAAATITNQGNAITTGEVASPVVLATLGSNYSYESGDIVLM